MEQISNNNDIKLMNSNTHHFKSIYLLIKDTFCSIQSVVKGPFVQNIIVAMTIKCLMCLSLNMITTK